ncbi:MAG: hypothetical protein GXZ11_03220 [Tissierellia bacterium]|nr:hypothetical protein [Tissierellia bacterium]
MSAIHVSTLDLEWTGSWGFPGRIYETVASNGESKVLTTAVEVPLTPKVNFMFSMLSKKSSDRGYLSAGLSSCSTGDLLLDSRYDFYSDDSLRFVNIISSPMVKEYILRLNNFDMTLINNGGSATLSVQLQGGASGREELWLIMDMAEGVLGELINSSAIERVPPNNI